jgi:hypothetical protein
MPAETLYLHYGRDYRTNRRRPKHPILQAIVRVTLLIVALGIVIGVLMRLGFIQEREDTIELAQNPGSIARLNYQKGSKELPL